MQQHSLVAPLHNSYYKNIQHNSVVAVTDSTVPTSCASSVRGGRLGDSTGGAPSTLAQLCSTAALRGAGCAAVVIHSQALHSCASDSTSLSAGAELLVLAYSEASDSTSLSAGAELLEQVAANLRSTVSCTPCVDYAADNHNACSVGDGGLVESTLHCSHTNVTAVCLRIYHKQVHHSIHLSLYSTSCITVACA
eukprot:5147-Heterococcus_DN1.PRE.1